MATYLYRTNGTATNSQKMTFSTWFKIGSGAAQKSLFGSVTGSGPYTQVKIMTLATHENVFRFEASSVEGNAIDLKLNRSLRDPSAWYHLVIAIDTTQVSASDRAKIYINGVQETSFATSTYPTQNDTLDFSKTGIQAQVGAYNNTEHWDGMFAHTYFIDGLQYAASTFGETDSTSGIWVAKASVSVTYGNNGFLLTYASGASGTDSSGEGNDFTVSGTMTNLKDSPDNNFCTMNPLDNYFANQTFTNTNNTVKSDHPAPAVGTIALTSGKWYFEGKAIVTTGGSDWQFGLVSKQRSASEQEIGNFPSEYSYRGSNGYIRTDNSETAYGATYTTGDIIGCAVDLTNLKLYFSKNGVWQDSGVPTSGATGTGAISITDPATISGQNQIEAYLPAAGADASANDYTWSMNFGNGYWGTASVGATNEDDAGIGVFAYDVPAGYYAICTDNLGDQS